MLNGSEEIAVLPRYAVKILSTPRCISMTEGRGRVKSTNMNRMQEQEKLRQVCIAIIDFLLDFIPDPQMFRIIEGMKSTVNNTFERKNQKGMKIIYSELKQWASELPPAHLSKLSLLINEKFDLSFLDELKDQENTVSEILARGKIISDDEFRLVNHRVDQICADKKKFREVELLNQLLSEYQSNRN